MCFSRDELANSNLGRGMSDTDKCRAASFHSWVEDSLGEVVFDPEFITYKLMKHMNGCDVDEPMVYHRYDNQEACVDIVMKHAVRRSIDYSDMKCIADGVKTSVDRLIRPGFCNLNCLNFMRGKQGRGYKVVVGAAGWRQKNGDIWFEWG